MVGKTRLLVGCVAAVLALVGVWVWLAYLDTPGPTVAVHHSDQPAPEPASKALTETADKSPTPPKTQPAEQPPDTNQPADDEADNESDNEAEDEAEYNVRVRYTDADTGLPVALARCAEYLTYVERDSEATGPEAFSLRLAGRYVDWGDTHTTDARGQIAARVEVLDDSQDKVSIELRVPEDWFVWTCWAGLHQQLAARARGKSTEPLQVPLRRAANLALDVKDTGGQPVPNYAVTLRWDVQTSGAPFDAAVKRAAGGEVEYGDDMEGPVLLDDLHRVGFWSSAMLERPPEEPEWPEALFTNQVQQYTTDARRLFTSSSGRAEFSGLAPGGYTLVLEDNQGTRIEQRLELAPGTNSHEVVLDNAALNTVALTVEWDGPEDERPHAGSVELAAVLGGHGVMPAGRGAHAIGSYNHRLDKSGPLLEGQILNLADGVWLVGFEVPGFRVSERVEVRGGRTLELTLRLAFDIDAIWEPTVLFDGHVINDLQLNLTGVFGGATSVSTGESGEVAPGWYVAQVPGLEPVVLEFEPRQYRRDVFVVPAVRMQFTISENLYNLLAGPEPELQFQVSPEFSIWPWNHEPSEHEVTFSHLRTSIMFEPDKPVLSTLPVGIYRWNLDGIDTVTGNLRVALGGQQHIHFDFDSLFGVGVLEVNLEGFSSQEEVDVHSHGSSFDGLVAEALIDLHGSLSRLWDVSGSYVSTFRTGAGRVLVFTEAASTVLQVYRSGGGQQQMITLTATVPGTLWVTPAMFDAPTGMLDIIDSSESEEPLGPMPRWPSHWSIFGISEVHGVKDLGYGEQELPQGRWRVVVVDDLNRGTVFAIADIDIGEGTYTLDVASLTFRRGGQLSVLMYGTSTQAPRSPYAIEMLDWALLGQVPRLDGGSGEGPRLWLNPARAEYRYSNLPPGRYRIIPRKDSPESEWVTFDVIAGESVTVSIGAPD